MKTDTIAPTENIRSAIGEVLEFKWTTSRGADTYGYNICSLRDRRGNLLGRCNGGGYDMEGTSFGNWIQKRFQPELLALVATLPHVTKWHEDGCRWERPESANKYRNADTLYGLTWNIYKNGKQVVSMDGACGFSSMQAILRAIGLDVRYIHKTNHTKIYEVVAHVPQA